MPLRLILKEEAKTRLRPIIDRYLDILNTRNSGPHTFFPTTRAITSLPLGVPWRFRQGFSENPDEGHKFCKKLLQATHFFHASASNFQQDRLSRVQGAGFEGVSFCERSKARRGFRTFR